MVQSIIEYYQNSNEDSRLTTDNARKIEFLMTTKTLDKYLKPSHSILELGAGTGVYSFYFANKGNKVIATDLTPKHIDQIKEKMNEQSNRELSLEAKVVNATQLNEFEDESVDTVLCLGPMYHLIKEQDRKKCIEESIRVLKRGGLFGIAYINKHYILHSVMTNNKEYLSKPFIDKILKTEVIKDGEEECFWTDAFFSSPDEMERLVEYPNIQIIDHVATDGFSPYIKNFVNDLNDNELSTWLYYIETSCRDKHILGLSNHGLLLCKKL